MQSTDDAVFSPTSPSAGDFVVDLSQESTSESVGIGVFVGAETVRGSPAVFISALTPHGLAASDGRLRAGECAPPTWARSYGHGE